MKGRKVSNRAEMAGLLADFDRSHTERFGAAADHAVEIFEDVRTSYDGRWLFFEEDGARLLIGLGDFGRMYAGVSGWELPGQLQNLLAEQDVNKIKTIGSNVCIVLFCAVQAEKEPGLFFRGCLDEIRDIYREYDIVITEGMSGQTAGGLLAAAPSGPDGDGGFRYYTHGGAAGNIYHIPAQTDMSSIWLGGEGPVYLAVPENADVSGLFPDADIKRIRIEISHYRASEDRPYLFVREEFSRSGADILEITYDQLLLYQRQLNLICLKEHVEEYGGRQFLIYTAKGGMVQEEVVNPRLAEMIKSRRREWELVPDVALMYPVSIEDVRSLADKAAEYDQDMNTYMHDLDIRLQCETGVPYGHDGSDMMERFKERIRRYYLGVVKCRITEEMIMDILDRQDVSVGEDIYCHLLVAADAESGVGVLYVVSLSSPFLLSHLMDNVVRNQLMVIDGEGKRINLYGYIRKSWGLSICGTPKSYVTVPKEKAALDDQQLAALLLSETIYEEGEDFSRLVDREIISKAEAPFGSGQYDIAYVGVSLNTFIQFYPSYRGTVEYRLFWNSVTAFYIELILFEEAAINRFNKALVSLMSEANEDLPEDFLEKNRKITNEFLSTVEFWDVQLNYPSSQKSISMIRDAFAQKTLLARMARYQEQVKNIFEINKELVDRRAEKEEKKSNDRMNFILFILTVVSTVSAVYQTVDYVMAYMTDDPVRNIFPLLTNIVILAFVGLLYRIKYR